MKAFEKLLQFAQDVGADFKALAARSIPPGGAVGQALVKSGTDDYTTTWGYVQGTTPPEISTAVALVMARARHDNWLTPVSVTFVLRRMGPSAVSATLSAWHWLLAHDGIGYEVDWGDATAVESVPKSTTAATASHVYAQPGTYSVRVRAVSLLGAGEWSEPRAWVAVAPGERPPPTSWTFTPSEPLYIGPGHQIMQPTQENLSKGYASEDGIAPLYPGMSLTADFGMVCTLGGITLINVHDAWMYMGGGPRLAGLLIQYSEDGTSWTDLARLPEGIDSWSGVFQQPAGVAAQYVRVVADTNEVYIGDLCFY